MFDKRYEVILADTDEARRVHYRLRYQVYCMEEGFEAHDKFPDRMERDTPERVAALVRRWIKSGAEYAQV